MTSIARSTFPAGQQRAHRRHTPFSGTAVGALLMVLGAIDGAALSGATRVRQALHVWAQRRHERDEDRKLWELALTDPRVMADLVALSQHEG